MQDYRIRIYERYASNFQDASPQFNPVAASRWAKGYDYYLRNWLPADKAADIVDVACGGGKLLLFFKERGYTRVNGVDISPDQVNLARQVIPDVTEANAVDFLESHKGAFDRNRLALSSPLALIGEHRFFSPPWIKRGGAKRRGGSSIHAHNVPSLKLRRKARRAAMTPAEIRHWQALKNCQVDGLKSRRQHRTGPLIMDFYDSSAKRVVELDGSAHDSETAWRRNEPQNHPGAYAPPLLEKEGKAGVAWMERSLRSAIQVPPAMIIVWAIAIYRKASLPRLIAMQRRVLAETMIKARLRVTFAPSEERASTAT